MKNIKMYTVFAGVNGVGKSTLFAAEDSVDFGVRLNSDDEVRRLGADWKSTAAQIKAGKIILDKQRECFDKGWSFNQETTLCGNNILKTIIRAKELGYVIDFNYIGVESPYIAKERVLRRMALGGHGVSEETIDRRYYVSMQNLVKVFPLCDKFRLYDNSGEGLLLIAYCVNKEFVFVSSKCEWANKIIGILMEN